MYIDDKINSCKIFDKYLLDDLSPYSLSEGQAGLNVVYPDGSSNPVSFKLQHIDTIIDSSITTENDIWMPAFLSSTASGPFIDNHILSRNGILTNNRIGIESFMTFKPQFQNWTVNQSSSVMSTDWFVNGPLIPFAAEYSLLFWFRLNTEKTYTFDEIPNDTKIKCLSSFSYKNNDVSLTIDTNTFVIKKNKDLLVRLDKSDVIVNGTEITKSTERAVPTSTIDNLATLQFKIVKESSLSNIETRDVDLWIPNGENFWYYNTPSDKNNNINRSLSYISPSLYSIYRQIYHAFTINLKKEYSSLNNQKIRFLKKICQAIATSPAIDRVTHSYLLDSEIQQFILNQVINNTQLFVTNNAAVGASNIFQDEINVINNFSKLFFKRIKDLTTSNKVKNLSSNYIHNKNDLFKKMIHKYGSDLKMSAKTNLTYKSKLQNGPHVFINHPVESRSPKISSSTLVYNNQSIFCGNFSIATQINSRQSIINVNSTTIPLYDIAKTFGTLQTTFTAGSDLVVGVSADYIPGNIFTIKLDDATDDNQIKYVWKKSSGPSLKFTDINKDKFSQVLYNSSTAVDPELRVCNIGKYILDCTASTELGVVIDSISVYVVNTTGNTINGIAPGEYAPGLRAPRNVKPSETIKISRDPVSITNTTSNFKVICPNLAQIGISKYGIFWPAKTDCYISIVGNKGQVVDDQALGAARLEKTERFAIPIETVMDSDASLVLQYDPNNTTMILSRIIMENMRDSKDECKACKGFFEDILVRSDKQQDFYRRLRFPDSIILNSYSGPDDTVGGDPKTFEYPNISTKHSPNILAYGGYQQSVIENLGVDIPYHPAPGTPLSIVSGHPMATPTQDGKPYHLCHLKQVPITGNILFEKGVFHPHSGWCIAPETVNEDIQRFSVFDTTQYSNIKNKTSSLKFNTGNRKTFTFAGPGFVNLQSSYDPAGNNLKNLYSSAVVLRVSSEVLSFFPEDREITQEDIDVQEKKEINDIGIHHGYRNLDHGYFVDSLSDEYIVTANQDLTEFNCSVNSDGFNSGSSAFNEYSFTTRGSRLARTSEVPEHPKIQGGETLGLTIQDIEVRLNFLNYVNTKNLMVWLEADLAPVAAKNKCTEQNQPNKNDLFINGTNFINNLNPEVSGYVQSLTDLNASLLSCPTEAGGTASAKLKLFLLNKEHIQNNKYNVSLHFSDHVPNETVASNKNIINNEELLHNQNIANHTIYLQPTIIPTGYSDLESIQYSNIINSNQLNLNNNKFAKFNNLPLFSSRYGADSSTTFTLKIAVLDENDEMRVYDNLKNNDLLAQYKTAEEKQQSSQIYNSLCSWDLIIHTSTPTFTEKDALGLIDYTSSPSIPGYNFIADFKDQKYRIPLNNINAPNYYLNNTNLCRYDDPTFPKTKNQLIAQFPTWAILNILANIFVGSNGTLLGTLMGDTSTGYNAITGYFNDLRQQATLTEYSRYVGKGNYDKYGFGSPEKALLNISKDGLVWYKLEAPIFKYTNSHILNKKKYKFIHLHKDTAKLFSNFAFNIVQSLGDIFETKFTTTKNIESLSGLKVEDTTLSIDDIIDVQKQEDKAANGLYLIKESAWDKLDSTKKIPNKILEQNNLINLSLSSIKIADKQKNCLIIEGKRAFRFFNVGQSLELSTINRNDKTEGTVNATINSKGYVFKNNKHYTLLLLNAGETNEYSINTGKYLGLNQNSSDMVFIYQDNPTQIEKSPISKWGLEKFDNKINSAPEQNFSVLGEGSYGTGSNFLRPNILSSISEENTIEPIYKILNNHENDRYKTNKLTLILPDGTVKTTSSKVSGFAFGQQDFEYITTSNFKLIIPSSIDQTDPIVSKQIEKIKEIASKTSYKNLQNYSFMDIKCSDFTNVSNFTQEDGTVVDYGEIMIENDFDKINPVQDLTQEQITTLSTRLSFLYSHNEQYTDLASYGENVDIKTLSIQDLENYYNVLEEDPLNCYQKTSFVPETCKKISSKQQLRYLYQERNDIISLLEEKATRTTDSNGVTTYSPRISTPGILPYFYFDIMTNTDGSVKITKKNNSDYYWINIDPNQQCQLATDQTVKILTKVTYQCISTAFNIGGGQIIGSEFFHVCPNDAGNISSGTDENFENSGGKFTYSIPSGVIETEKSKYPQITSWKESELPGPYTTRNFSVNAGGAKDIVVLVTEKYLMPSQEYIAQGSRAPIGNVSNKVQDIFNLDDTQQLFVQFRNIPRKLKGVDQHYDKLTPTNTGAYASAFKGVGANINNELMMWRCINKGTGAYTEIPDYYKLQNEMIFRAFFGSVDGIEHKNTIQSDNKDPWEWIPYEYE